MPELPDLRPGLFQAANAIVCRIIEEEERQESPDKSHVARLLKVAQELARINQDLPE